MLGKRENEDRDWDERDKLNLVRLLAVFGVVKVRFRLAVPCLRSPDAAAQDDVVGWAAWQLEPKPIVST